MRECMACSLWLSAKEKGANTKRNSMNNNFNDNERTAEPLMIDKQRNDT